MRPVRTERDKIAAKARRMTRDPVIAAVWREAWNRVLDRLAPHHSNEFAREAMLRALVAGKSIAAAETISFDSANKR